MKTSKAQRNIIYYFLTIMISFFIGYFILTISNTITSKYECKFETNFTINNDLLSLDNLNKAKESNKNHSNIDTTSLFYKNGISLEQINNTTYVITTYTRYYDNFFLKDKQTISTRAKTFIKSLLKEYTESQEITYLYEDTLITKDYFNPFLSGFISIIILLPLSIILKKRIIKDTPLYNNDSIFTISYWKTAKSFLSSPKKIATLAMIFSLLLISKIIKIPSGFANLGVSFGFIFLSIIGIIYGPLAGLLIGALSDILGFFLFDASSSFFIGYVFQAMISGFLHAIFLYKKRITYIQILLMRVTISIICNILIGSICWGIVANYTFSQTISYMFIFVLPKNIVYLIPQSIILFLILKAILPILSKFNLIDVKLSKNVTIY